MSRLGARGRDGERLQKTGDPCSFYQRMQQKESNRTGAHIRAVVQTTRASSGGRLWRGRIVRGLGVVAGSVHPKRCDGQPTLTSTAHFNTRTKVR